MRNILIMILLLLGAAGCEKRFDMDSTSHDGAFTPNADMSVLQRIYDGSPATVNEDIVVTGTVVSSDAGGNFYRTVVVQDPTGTVEIMAGLDYLYRTYPVGSRVSVRLQGLAVGQTDGILQIGLPAESWDYLPAIYLSHRAIVDAHVRRTGMMNAVKPERMVIGDLTRRACGRLVTISAVACDDEAATWADGEYRCYRKFRDRNSDSIYVVTSPYARYASRNIPRDTVDLTGILLYGKAGGSRDCFILKMRTEDDVSLH